MEKMHIHSGIAEVRRGCEDLSDEEQSRQPLTFVSMKFWSTGSKPTRAQKMVRVLVNNT
jgi:hypothetical protein